MQALAAGDAQAVHTHASAAWAVAARLAEAEGAPSEPGATHDCAALGHVLAVVFAPVDAPPRDPVQPTAGTIFFARVQGARTHAPQLHSHMGRTLVPSLRCIRA